MASNGKMHYNGTKSKNGNDEGFKQLSPLTEKEKAYLRDKFWVGIRCGSKLFVASAVENGISVNSTDEHGSPAIITAIMHNHNHIVDYLIDNNADVNCVYRGETPLIVAVRVMNAEIIDMLLKRNVDVNFRDAHGFIALSYAITFGSESIIRRLVDNGSDINSSSNIGMTPLALALSARKVSIAKYLISKGADVLKADNQGITPLMRAAVIPEYLEPAELITEIISRGADVNAVDNAGRTAYYYARQYECFSNAKLLRKHGAKIGFLWW
ncbi:MAG: ankyrin repeat domain-containing protein [Candidatus Micrarchaeia archaeon]